jgi:hypothetical protein
MIAKRAFLPLFALSLALSACKQDEPTVDSGVTESKLGSDLTPAEQDQLCEAVFDFTAEIITPAEAKRAACTFEAVLYVQLNGGDAAACATLRDGCIDKPDEPGTEPAMCTLGIDWASCMATVGEIEDCREENARATITALKSIDCAKIEEYKNDPPEMGEPQLGEKCSLAQAKCASVLGGVAMP